MTAWRRSEAGICLAAGWGLLLWLVSTSPAGAVAHTAAPTGDPVHLTSSSVVATGLQVVGTRTRTTRDGPVDVLLVSATSLALTDLDVHGPCRGGVTLAQRTSGSARLDGVALDVVSLTGSVAGTRFALTAASVDAVFPDPVTIDDVDLQAVAVSATRAAVPALAATAEGC